MKKTGILMLFLFAGLHGIAQTNGDDDLDFDVDTEKLLEVYEGYVRNKTNQRINGMKAGRWLDYGPGYLPAEGYYVDDVKQGEWKMYHRNGSIQSRTFFRDGELHGACSRYYEDGQPRQVGTYVNGKISGSWVSYDTSGKATRTETYEAGALIDTSTH